MSGPIRITLLPILLLPLFFFIPGVRSLDTPGFREPLFVQAAEDQVWVNTATGIYNFPGTRSYGNTNQGEFMSEKEAQAHGYRASKIGQLDG
jgi:hypothetical protein